jgi:hypothetical protein
MRNEASLLMIILRVNNFYLFGDRRFIFWDEKYVIKLRDCARILIVMIVELFMATLKL